MSEITLKKAPVGVAFQLDENSFVRSGYCFKNWNTKSDGTGTSYADKSTNSFQEDVTLYAQWVPAITNVNDVQTATSDLGANLSSVVRYYFKYISIDVNSSYAKYIQATASDIFDKTNNTSSITTRESCTLYSEYNASHPSHGPTYITETVTHGSGAAIIKSAIPLTSTTKLITKIDLSPYFTTYVNSSTEYHWSYYKYNDTSNPLSFPYISGTKSAVMTCGSKYKIILEIFDPQLNQTHKISIIKQSEVGKTANAGTLINSVTKIPILAFDFSSLIIDLNISKLSYTKSIEIMETPNETDWYTPVIGGIVFYTDTINK